MQILFLWIVSNEKGEGGEIGEGREIKGHEGEGVGLKQFLPYNS